MLQLALPERNVIKRPEALRRVIARPADYVGRDFGRPPRPIQQTVAGEKYGISQSRKNKTAEQMLAGFGRAQAFKTVQFLLLLLLVSELDNLRTNCGANATPAKPHQI